MRSTLFIVGAICAILAHANEEDRTSTIVNTNTITVTTCGSGCVDHGSTTTPTVSTPCETPVPGTLVTSVVSSIVPVTNPTTLTPTSEPAGSYVIPSTPGMSVGPPVVSVTEPSTLIVPTSTITQPSYIVPGSVTPSSVNSSSASPTPVSPSSNVPIFTNSTAIITASGTPITHTSTSVVVVNHPSTTAGLAPSSSSTGLNDGARMVIPGVMLGLLAVSACVFA